MKQKLDIDGFKNSYEQYVNDTVVSMVNIQKIFVINLYQLNSTFIQAMVYIKTRIIEYVL